MKSLAEIIKRKKKAKTSGVNASEDAEKYIGRIFSEAAISVKKNVSGSEISSVNLKEGILSVRTSHPSIAGELWRSREKIRKRVNFLLGAEKVRSLRIK